MPAISFSPGLNSSPADLILLFDKIGTGSVTGMTPTQITYTAGLTTITISGAGFAPGPGGTILGTISGAQAVNGLDIVTITGLSLPAQTLRTQAALDASGADNTALETLFLPLGWTYTGNANADVLLSTTTSSDGVLLNFTGNDSFILNAGNDRVFAGNGNDTVNGGAGLDTLWGGLGNDKMIGGSGADVLFGDQGADRLTGGRGNDTMTGGPGLGIDTFVFLVGDGQDMVTDFQVARDKIDLATGVAHSFSAGAGGIFLHYGPGVDSIFLVGLGMADAALVTLI
ncbi:calcium-binding protein [Stagnihabitans tardus]|nr:hypothetical protein [Stagnihabitans tardus]